MSEVTEQLRLLEVSDSIEIKKPFLAALPKTSVSSDERSAGASNAANAVAPLVGSGSLTASQGVLLAIGAIGVGAFTIARRTLDTVGEDLTDLPILAAIDPPFHCTTALYRYGCGNC